MSSRPSNRRRDSYQPSVQRGRGSAVACARYAGSIKGSSTPVQRGPTPLLDLGCGVGEPALTAARRWPAVIGLDQDEQALQTARQRAQAQGLDNAEFREGFEHLGLEDASAAAAIPRFGLLMLGDGEAEFPDTDGAIDYLLEAGGPFTGFYAALSDQQLDEVRAVQRELIREQETRSASAVTLRSSCRIFSGARRPGMSSTWTACRRGSSDKPAPARWTVLTTCVPGTSGSGPAIRRRRTSR
jgi:SAM-dependent methyltransferase